MFRIQKKKTIHSNEKSHSYIITPQKKERRNKQIFDKTFLVVGKPGRRNDQNQSKPQQEKDLPEITLKKF